MCFKGLFSKKYSDKNVNSEIEKQLNRRLRSLEDKYSSELRKSISGISEIIKQQEDKHERKFEAIHKKLDELNEIVKDKREASLTSNPAEQSVSVVPSNNSDIKGSVVEPKSKKELLYEKPKDNCMLFNEQINSELTSLQFKSIRLSFNSYKNLTEDSEGISLYIANIGNYTFELYPNQNIKDSRFREKFKYAFDFETENMSNTAKIFVKKPCILREYMSGYTIVSRGLIDIS